MSKEIDNEWGIDDISELGDSTENKNIEVDGQTRAFGGKMPDKEVTADLTNVISSQIIIDAVKHGKGEDEFAGDYSVDAELYAEDYTEEFATADIEEALVEAFDEIVSEDEYDGSADEEYYEEDEPEYYDEEEVADASPEDYYAEPEKPIKHKAKTSDGKNSNHKKSGMTDGSEDGNDKMFIIGSIIVFVLIVLLGVALLTKLYKGGSDKKPQDEISIDNDYDIDDQGVNQGLLDANSGNSTEINGSAGNNSDNNNTSHGNSDSINSQNDKPGKDDKPAATQTECEKNGHKFKDATCTEPKTCSVCGKKEGNALGHDFENADCTKPTTCKRCGQTGTDALGHTYSEATCTEPKKCTRCGATEGEALGHDFEEATCEKPATCKRCKETKGEKGEHKFEEVSSTMTGDKKTVTYKCSVCGETKTEEGKADPGPMTDEQKVAKVIELVNAERASAGLPPLTTTPELTRAANARAKEVATSFSHTRPDGRDAFTVLADNGISYTTCGENMAAGQKTPEEVVESWMSSSTHKANILNANYTHIGIGYYNSGSGYTYYWVQMFTD